jgi:hypothetical protein
MLGHGVSCKPTCYRHVIIHGPERVKIIVPNVQGRDQDDKSPQNWRTLSKPMKNGIDHSESLIPFSILSAAR